MLRSPPTGITALSRTRCRVWGGTDHGTLCVWHADTHELQKELIGHRPAAVSALCAVEDCELMLSGGGQDDGRLIVWNDAQ